MQQLIRYLARNPRKLFLIDSLGALLTAFLLVAVLMPFQPLFGVPVRMLRLLAGLALTLALYSGGCFLFVGPNWRPFLTAIAWANGLYCCLTAGLVIARYAQLTALGVAYFVVEVALISLLIVLERRVIAQAT